MIRLRIRELAEARGLNQRKLAEKSGVTEQLMSRYWRSQLDRVELAKIEKIADALGVPPGDLFEKV